MPLRTKVKNGVKYYEVFIECPVCLEQGRHTPRTYWVHHVCGDRIYLGSNAYYHCPTCDLESHVMKWKYKCPNHNTNADAEYLGIDRAATIAQVVATAGMYATEAGLAWLNEFIVNLSNDIED